MTSAQMDAPLAVAKRARSMRGVLAFARAAWFLPVLSAVVILAVLVALRPIVASFTGFSLVLAPLLPLIFAVLAQMFTIGGGDIDLGIGFFIGLVNVIAAVTLGQDPVLGIVLLLLLIAAYAAMGALIALRRLPSIVVTLGMSFVWLGAAIVLLPTPGGLVPQWLVMVVRFNPGPIPRLRSSSSSSSPSRPPGSSSGRGTAPSCAAWARTPKGSVVRDGRC